MADFNSRGFHGINENTAPQHFDKLSEEYGEVTWGHFWRWAKSNYALPNSHSWIQTGVFRRYFVEHYDSGTARTLFNRLFAIHATRKASNADDTPKRKTPKKRNGNGRNGESNEVRAASIRKDADALQKRIKAALDANQEEAERLVQAATLLEWQ